MVQNVLASIPSEDVAGIASIYVTAAPETHRQHQRGAPGAYYPKHSQRPAYIAVYLKNLFGPVSNSPLAGHLLPILEWGLAQTIFHEIGHHQQHIRSHGVTKRTQEGYADAYAKERMRNYLRENTDRIHGCFERIQTLAKSREVSLAAIEKIQAEWEAEYRKLIVSEKDSSE